MSWATIRSRVLNTLAQENNSATDAEIAELANEAIDQLNEIMRPQSYSFTSSDWTGRTTTADGVTAIRLPTNIIGPLQSVVYDGDLIDQVDPVAFEDYRNGLGVTGDPVYTVVGTTFTTDAPNPALLTIRAQKALPYYADPDGAGAQGYADGPDPMADMPVTFQMLPAFYVLARFSASPDVPREMARQQNYQGLWEQKLQSFRAALNNLGAMPYNWD